MDRGPGKLPNTTSRLIAMAVSLVGKESPLDVFDRLVNLIIREQGKLIAKNKELLARIRTRHEP